MRQHRYSIRLHSNGREVAMADDREGADLAIQTVISENSRKSLRGTKHADYDIVDNLASFRSAVVEPEDGDEFTVYVTEDVQRDATVGQHTEGFTAVDNPFAKEADQVEFYLEAGGRAYGSNDGGVPFDSDIGSWTPRWQYQQAGR